MVKTNNKEYESISEISNHSVQITDSPTLMSDNKTLEEWKNDAESYLCIIARQRKYWTSVTADLQNRLEKIRKLVHGGSEFSIAEDLEELLNNKLGDKQKLKKRIKELESENNMLRTAFEALKRN